MKAKIEQALRTLVDDAGPEHHRSRYVLRDDDGNPVVCVVVARAPCCAAGLDAWFDVTKERDAKGGHDDV
jgi:hypothetical protein